jgi:hypothetical protein
MKINFRQGLMTVISALLLFSGAGAWGACENELEAVNIANRDNFAAERRDRHRQLIATKDFPKITQGTGAGNYEFNWFQIDGIELSYSIVQIDGKKNLLQFLQTSLRKNTNPQSQVDVLSRYRQRQYVVASVTEIEYQNCISAFILGQNTRPLSANSSHSGSETKQQPQQNQAQQQSQQAQQAAQQNQSRADQQRQGKRKTNDPAAQAHECVAIDQAGSGNFGAFKNTCAYKVNFTTCNYRPRTIQGGFNWSADFDCEKQQYGLHTPDAGRTVAAHNRNTEMVYWFACKAPATPVDAAFVVGKGIEARCHN